MFQLGYTSNLNNGVFFINRFGHFYFRHDMKTYVTIRFFGLKVVGFAIVFIKKGSFDKANCMVPLRKRRSFLSYFKGSCWFTEMLALLHYIKCKNPSYTQVEEL